MNLIKTVTSTALLFFLFQTVAIAQTDSLTEIFKSHMNETVQNVKSSESADEKRTVLNSSFNKMLKAVEKIEESGQLSEDEIAQLTTLKHSIEEKSDQLNGRNGFEEIADEDLEDFSDYSQQAMEQADRSLTISLTTALLVVIILLLL
jgi:hypothetical protein